MTRHTDPESLENYRFFLLTLSRRYVNGRLRKKTAHMDLVQQTLLLACKHLSSYRGSTDAEFRGWLAAILRRQCINESKRYFGTSKRDAESETLALDDTLISRDPSASDVAIQKESTEKLFLAISMLSEQQRAVVFLRLMRFMSVEEVAEHLGVSRHAVLRRWKSALLRLRTLLAESE